MKVTLIQAAEGMLVNQAEWSELKRLIMSEKSDILVTNEMPFGKWLACVDEYQHAQAQLSITDHQEGLKALQSLDVPYVLSSQPKNIDEVLVNEAFVLDHGEYRCAHHKHYFPDEASFYETAWFSTVKKGFDVITTEHFNVGFLLCTEIMFNEWARHYRRNGAHVIVVPRAAGQSVIAWKAAMSMAAVVSGCYVISSNRVGQAEDGFMFGGQGLAYAPDGQLIAETSDTNPVVSIEMDLSFVNHQQKQYPCYVNELSV